MIDVAIPQFDSDASPARPTLEPARTLTTFSQRRREEEEYYLDHKNDDEDDDKKDEFFDTQDMKDDVIIRYSMVYDDFIDEMKQLHNVHQKIFEFTFSVDRVQTSVFRSNADPNRPDRLLANAVLEGFHLEFALRPFDMSVDVLLRSLYVEDKIVDDKTEFRHFITSKKLGAADGTQAQDLVRIRYQGVQKISPEFMTVHEGIDKASGVFCVHSNRTE